MKRTDELSIAVKTRDFSKARSTRVSSYDALYAFPHLAKSYIINFAIDNGCTLYSCVKIARRLNSAVCTRNCRILSDCLDMSLSLPSSALHKKYTDLEGKYTYYYIVGPDLRSRVNKDLIEGHFYVFR